jgi:curved DNA-binding protein CbpA
VGPVKDYYAIMGISRRSTQVAIEARYRALVKIWHPDKPGGDTRRFQEIQEAYEILGNAKNRTAYDADWDSIKVRQFVPPVQAPQGGPVDLLGIFEKFAEGRVPDQFVNQISPVLERKLAEHGVNARAATAESILEAVGWLKPKKGRKRA